MSIIVFASDKNAFSQSNDDAWRSWYDTKVGSMKISGRVIGESGSLLDSVNVSISRICFENGHYVENAHEIAKNEGEFSFKYNNTIELDIKFTKKGYYAQERRYLYDKPPVECRVQDKTLQCDNVEVVLEKVINPTQLKKDRILLTLEPDGSGKVWDLGAVGETVSRWNRMQVEIDPQKAPYPHMYLRLRKVEKRIAPVIHPLGHKITPEDAYLEIVLSDRDESGFIVVEDGKKSEKDLFLAMKTAPEKGYAPVMTVPFDASKSSYKGVRFFIRIKGLYGKGYILSSHYNEKKTTELRLTVHLQPDKSRNLESTLLY